MKIAVYTTIFGNYDNLKDVPEQNSEADFYCITDNPNIQHKDWQTIYSKGVPCNVDHPRMKAKFFKLMPFAIKELAKYEILIFIDATIQITTPEFINYCIAPMVTNDIALFEHPERNNIFAEAEGSKRMSKYNGQLIDGQINNYKDIIKEHKLYACGVMTRRFTDKITIAMKDWLLENIQYSYQDQLSFPIIAYLHDLKPFIYPHNQLKCPHFAVKWNMAKIHL